MTHLKQTLTLLLTIVAFTAFSQRISLDSTDTNLSTPKVTIISDTEKSTIIDINLSGFKMINKNVDGIYYNVLDLFTDSKTNVIGAPSLPIIPSLIAIPDNASVSYEIIETGEVKTYENINILPW